MDEAYESTAYQKGIIMCQLLCTGGIRVPCRFRLIIGIEMNTNLKEYAILIFLIYINISQEGKYALNTMFTYKFRTKKWHAIDL